MNVKKTILTLILLAASLPAAQARGPVTTFGVEWGFCPQIWQSTELNYISQAGYRIDSPSSGMSFFSNGCVMGDIGINAGERLTVSALSGYMGVSQNNRVIPVLLRAGWHFNGTGNDGIFVFADGGAGFHLKREGEPDRRPAAMADAGLGYRFALTRRSSIDVRFNVKGTFDSLLVKDPDSGEYLPEKNIRKNEAFFLALNLGISINF